MDNPFLDPEFNTLVVPICRYCNIQMDENISLQKGYRMWNCLKCGHNVFRILDSTLIIKSKLTEIDHKDI